MGGNRKKQAGLRIRRLRRSNRMSQQALAAAVGVHVNTMARWESTGIEPDHPRLPSIAAALHCSIEHLTGAVSYRRVASDWSASKFAAVAQFLAAYRARSAEWQQGR